MLNVVIWLVVWSVHGWRVPLGLMIVTLVGCSDSHLRHAVAYSLMNSLT